MPVPVPPPLPIAPVHDVVTPLGVKGQNTKSRQHAQAAEGNSGTVSLRFVAEMTCAVALLAAGEKNASSFPIFSWSSQDNNSLFLIS